MMQGFSFGSIAGDGGKRAGKSEGMEGKRGGT
jgi:hypothetical protein